MRPDHLDYTIDAFDFRNKPPKRARMVVTLQQELVAYYEKYNKAKAKNTPLVEIVLKDPLRAYMDTRAINEGYWAVASRPPERFDGSHPSDFPTDHIFVVYLSAQMFVHDYGMERVEPDDNTHMLDYKTRFGAVAWTHPDLQ